MQRHILRPLRQISKLPTHVQILRRKLPNLFTMTANGYTIEKIPGLDFHEPEVEEFLNNVHKMMMDKALKEGTNRKAKVVEFLEPTDLQKQLPLSIGDEAASTPKLMDALDSVIKYSVKTGHPQFYNQLYNGIDPYGLAGAWVTEALNTNGHTFEVAPPFILIEHYIIRKMCGILGFKNGDGIFSPGGSFSNMTAVHLARYTRNKDFKKTGMFGAPRHQMFTSEEAHYSLNKASSFMGFGIDNVVVVAVDDCGRMVPADLEAKVKQSQSQGHVPFFVMATCGTTVLGAYDPLNAIADVCQKYGMWMHVDAAWGGAAVLSKKHKHLMAGVERANSCAWNPHKMMGAPIQCSAFLLNNREGLLQECNAANATYLFQQDKFYDMSFDTGDKSLQCGRKVDAFKLWFMWKAKGDAGFERQIDSIFEMARYFADQVKSREGFRLVNEPECTNVSFWYVPPSMRGKEENDAWWDALGKVAPVIKEGMVRQGTMLIGYQPQRHKKRVNFFRIIIKNPIMTMEDLDYALDEIDRIGKTM